MAPTLRQVLAPPELEIELSVALVRFLRHFNLVDLNLGLSIAWLAKLTDPKSAAPKLESMTLERKLREFRRLANKCGLTRSEKERKDLEDWSTRFTVLRSLRNVFVHGHWDLLPLREEHPVSLVIPPWMQEKLGTSPEIKMTLNELRGRALQMEGLFLEFMKLRRKMGL